MGDAPRIDPNYLSHADDMAVFLEGWRRLREVYESEAMKEKGAEVVEFERFKGDWEEYGRFLLSNYALTIYHPVGTCKMGELSSDEMAVCDARLKVRTFQNLRVADASVAPDIIAGNTQGMCYVIGCKAAKMILEDWRK